MKKISTLEEYKNIWAMLEVFVKLLWAKKNDSFLKFEVYSWLWSFLVLGSNRFLCYIKIVKKLKNKLTIILFKYSIKELIVSSEMNCLRI